MSEEQKNGDDASLNTPGENTPPPSPEEASPAVDTAGNGGSNSVVWITRIVLLLAAAFFVWYIFSDRNTPYTDQGRVTEIILPVTPRVSGYLTEVRVRLHSPVRNGDLLFVVDTTPYALAVKKAEANLENVIQQLGAQGSSVKAAASRVGIARAQLDRALRNYNRTQRIIHKNPGALSQVDIDRVETSLDQARENLANAEANLEKTKKQLGPAGLRNPQLRMAINDLNNAQMQLDWTRIYAPVDGYIESFNLDVGYYCQAGKPLATIVSKEDLWIQANFKENNLTKMKEGDPVKILLDVAPGRIFRGHVRSISYGVSTGNTTRPGKLPAVTTTSTWLRDPQRFPVIVEITDTAAVPLCRAGGQADIVVYTGDHPLLNKIADLRIRINSWLSYVR